MQAFGVGECVGVQSYMLQSGYKECIKPLYVIDEDKQFKLPSSCWPLSVAKRHACLMAIIYALEML